MNRWRPCSRRAFINRPDHVLRMMERLLLCVRQPTAVGRRTAPGLADPAALSGALEAGLRRVLRQGAVGVSDTRIR